MAKIRLIAPEDAPYASSADSTRSDKESRNSNIDIRTYFPGDVDELSLFEVKKMPPVVAAAPHAHTVDEVMYILEGELIIGNRHYGPESAVYVPANTLYSFTYGENGVRYLNIRPRRDDTTLTKEEFMKRRSERNGADVGASSEQS